MAHPDRSAWIAVLLAALFVASSCVDPEDTLTQTEQEVFVPADQLVGTAAPAVHATFSWRMPGRARFALGAYNAVTRKYARSYIDPDGWDITLDACRSSATGTSISSYRWVVKGKNGIAFDKTVTTSDCKLHSRHHAEWSPKLPGCRDLREGLDLDCVPDELPDPPPVLGRLPKMGDYQVTLTVHPTHGEPATYSEIIRPRDLLIVSVGDSFSSGEGLPHDTASNDAMGVLSGLLDDIGDAVEGLPGFDYVAIGTIGVALGVALYVNWPVVVLTVAIGTPVLAGAVKFLISRADWWDEPCHRSFFAGPAVAARMIELADPHSSVTFLSYACSGAKLGDLYETSQASLGLPQLDAARRDICGGGSCTGPGKRGIDLLLVTAGINDLTFSSLLTECAMWSGDCHTNGSTPSALALDIDRKLAELPASYAGLAAHLTGFEVDEVMIAEYPRPLFSDDDNRPQGCMLRLSDAEAAWMSNSVGVKLNEAIHEAAGTHGWRYATGISAAFSGHGMCVDDEDDAYYNDLNDSFKDQGDELGTAHPNAAGHQVFGAMLALNAIPLHRSPSQVTVRIHEVYVADTLDYGLFDEPTTEVGAVKLGVMTYDETHRRQAPFGGGPAPINTTIATNPAGHYTFTVYPRDVLRISAHAELPAVLVEPARPGDEAQIRPPRRFSINLDLLASQGFSPGTHEVTSHHDNGYLRMRYTIEVLRERAPSAPSRRLGGAQDDTGVAIAHFDDGKIAAAGTFQGTATIVGAPATLVSSGGTNGWVAKFSHDIGLEWITPIRSTGTVTVRDVAVTPSRHIIVVGSFTGTLKVKGHTVEAVGEDGFVVHMNKTGGVRWLRRYGGTGAQVVAAIDVDPAGRIVVVGDFTQTLTAERDLDLELALAAQKNRDCFVAWLDPADGFVSSIRPLRTAGNCWSHDVANADDGTAAMVGRFTGTLDIDAAAPKRSSDGGQDGYVAVFTPSGLHAWSAYLGGSPFIEGDATLRGVGFDDEGRVYVAGHFTKMLSLMNGSGNASTALAWTDLGHDGFIGRFTADGAFEHGRLRTFGGSAHDYPTSMDVLGDGTVAIGGHTASTLFDVEGETRCTRGSWDGFVIQYAADGTLRWTQTFGTVNDDRANGVSLGAGRMVAVAGQFGGLLRLRDDVELDGHGGLEAVITRLHAPPPPSTPSTACPAGGVTM